MTKKSDERERRAAEERRFGVVFARGKGTRSGDDRRQPPAKAWPYFEKRSRPERRLDDDRRADDRRSEPPKGGSGGPKSK